MTRNAMLAATLAALVGVGGFAAPVTAQADGIFNMMNPFKWFNDDDDWDDYRRYGPGPYGWGGPYGWNGPYGYGPYGHPGAYGQPYPGAQRTVIVLPQTAQASGEVLPE